MGVRRFSIRLTVAVSVCFAVTSISRAAEPLSGEQQARYAALEAKDVTKFTNVDMGDYLALRRQALAADGETPDPAEEVGRYALRAVGQPFRLNAVRFDWTESDCVVLVQRCLAAALATDWTSFRLIADRICHRNGVVDYRERNFATLGDWLPNNIAWLLEDITGQLGPAGTPVAETFTHVVRPKVFAEVPTGSGGQAIRTVFKGSDFDPGRKEVRTDSFVPWKAIPGVLPQLRTGDVVLALYNAAGGHLGCDHMGVIVRGEDGTVNLVHSGPPRVRQEELGGYAKRFARLAGFKFLRLRGDARQRAAEEAVKMAVHFTAPDAASEDVRVEAMARNRALQPPQSPKPSLKHPYRVRPGDTWWSLAEEWLGDGNRWQELRDLNRAAAPGGHLRAGATIELEP